MLTIVEKILFFIFALVAMYYSYLGFKQIAVSVARGQSSYYPRYNHLFARIKEAIIRTMSQKTVFKARPVASFFHSFVFYGFMFYLLVNAFDALKGYIPNAWLEDVNLGVIGGMYRFLADFFSVFIIVGVAFFLYRRFIAKDKKLNQNPNTLLHQDVQKGSIKKDSLIVGIFIIAHVGFRILGETFLLASEGHYDKWQPVASTLAKMVGYGDGRIIGWHIGWWMALGLILLFLVYFPRSKHIHLFMAPVNFTIERKKEDGSKVPLGVLEPIDFEDETVEQFGVAKLEHLRQSQILDPYACIQCNRCSNVCPANSTGKALSPAAIEINKRYEFNTIIPDFAKGIESPREVMEFVLNSESLWACTTCGACIEVCPVGCEQMIDIIDIRRDQVMMKGEFPAELQTAFRGMERAGNPWGIGQDKRMEWAEGLNVPTVSENSDFEVLFWVGCAGSYDPAAQSTTKAMVSILEHANINYAVLGKGEKCTGDPARRAGNEYLYYQLATENVETLNAALIDENLDSSKEKRILTTCPHCFNALFNDYPQLGGNYKVMHHTELIEELMQAGKLPPLDLDKKLTYHDPCYLGRHNDIYDAPRNILNSGNSNITEMERNRNNSFCCGAGGAQFWKEEEEGDAKIPDVRFQEAMDTGAEIIAAACPFCKVMLDSSEKIEEENAPEVLDIAQIVASQLAAIQSKIDSSKLN